MRKPEVKEIVRHENDQNFELKRKTRYVLVFAGLLAAFFAIVVLSINTGNVRISVWEILKILLGKKCFLR